ncbi:MAG: ECF transporter S component [Oscillospiraceae bacterium]|nr:ECF transporter S component [Oscillospiraceae bacterium]
MNTTSKSRNHNLYFMVSVGMMAALCFVGNYLQIKIPNGVLITRIHFGNSMCLLSGLLLGGFGGGLASGIGAGLYDLLDPVYIFSAPFTFLSKFAMGYICGELASYFRTRHKGTTLGKTTGVLISGILGQITYIILYLAKTYLSQIILGYEVQTAITATVTNLITSSVNAVIAVAVSVPLYLALRVPLRHTGLSSVLNPELPPKGEGKKINPKTIIGIAAFAVLTIAAFALYIEYKLGNL